MKKNNYIYNYIIAVLIPLAKNGAGLQIDWFLVKQILHNGALQKE